MSRSKKISERPIPADSCKTCGHSLAMHALPGQACDCIASIDAPLHGYACKCKAYVPPDGFVLERKEPLSRLESKETVTIRYITVSRYHNDNDAHYIKLTLAGGKEVAVFDGYSNEKACARDMKLIIKALRLAYQYI